MDSEEENFLQDDDELRDVYWDPDVQILVSRKKVKYEDILQTDSVKTTVEEIEAELTPSKEDVIQEIFWGLSEHLECTYSSLYDKRSLAAFSQLIETSDTKCREEL